MKSSMHQIDADRVSATMLIDQDIIQKASTLHGQCIRLFVENDGRKWLFEDRFELKVKKNGKVI